MSRLIRDSKGQFVIIIALLIAALTLATIISIHSINIHSQSIAYKPANEFLLGITADMNRALTVALSRYTNEIYLNHTEETAKDNATKFMETWKQSALTSYSNYGIKIRTDLPQNMNPTFLPPDWVVNGISRDFAYVPYAFDVNSYGFMGWTGTTAKYVQLQITSVDVENWTTGLSHVEFQLMQSDVNVSSLRPIPDLPTNVTNRNDFQIGAYKPVAGTSGVFMPWTEEISLTYLGNGKYRATLSSPDPVNSNQTINPIHKGVRLELATPNDAIWIQNSYYLYEKANSTTTTQLSPPSPIIFGQNITDSATVTGLGEGFPIPSGQIQFEVSTDGGSTWTNSSMQKTLFANGTANSDTYYPLARNYNFRAVYFGDDNYYGSQSDIDAELMTVNKATPNVTTSLSATTITLGGSPNSITDEATVTSMGAAFPNATGLIDFQVQFGSSGWSTFSTAALNSYGKATSAEYTPLAAGTYYFRAVYSGDSNYNSAQSGDLEEPLTVNKATPKVTTLLDPQAITLGGSVTDTATVIGLGGIYPDPTGTVTFEVSIDDGENWTSFGSTKTLSSGSATSDLYTTTLNITYYFRAVYSGDSNYTSAASGDGDEPLTPGEASIVTTVSPPTIQLGNLVSDTATVTGIDGSPTPTGTVDFYIMKSGGSWTNYDSKILDASGKATSNSYTPLTAGDYYLKAVYSGDSNYTSVASGDTAEPLTVTKANATVTTLLSSQSIGLGQSILDSATVTGLGGDFPAPTGLVSFQVSWDGGLNWTTFSSDKALTGSSATSDSYMPNKVGTNLWYFRAFYQGDDNYNSATSNNLAEPLTVSQGSTVTLTQLSTSTITYGQGITDTAVVTGIGVGLPSPTGTVTFQFSIDGGSNWTIFGSPKTLISGSVISDLYEPFSAGAFNFKANYSGDINYLGSESVFDAEPLYVNMAPDTIGTLIISSPSVSGQLAFISNSSDSPLNPYDKINPQLSQGHESITVYSNFLLPSIITSNKINMTFLLKTTMVSNIPYQTIQADLAFTYKDTLYSIGTVIFNATASHSSPPPLYYYVTILVADTPFVPGFPVRAIPAGSRLQLTFTLIDAQNRVDVYGGNAATRIELF